MLPSSGAHNSSKTQCRDFKSCTNLDKYFMNNVYKNDVITLDNFLMRLNLLEYTFCLTPGTLRVKHWLRLSQNIRLKWPRKFK